MTTEHIPAPAFGSSGLRGLATAMTDDLVVNYAAAFARHFPNNGQLYLGRDLRASSPRIARAVASGAAAAGLEVVDCGVLPTPALALSAAKAGTIAVMVTGSHIPADRNGLKFYRRDGEITKDDEARIAQAVTTVRGVPANVTPGSAREDYIARYIDFLGPHALSGLRVGVWEQSSAAREILPSILQELGAEVVKFGRSDSFVAVDTEAVDETTRAKLAEAAAVHRLDAVVSTDGDADRPLLANEAGLVVPGDILGPLTARWLGAREVVTTISANTLVDAMGEFRAVHRCRIGSPFIIAGMEARAGNEVIGYEPNGGVLLGFAPSREGRSLAPLVTRDAVLPIAAVLAAASRAGGVSALVSALPSRRTATDRITDVPRAVSDRFVAALLQRDFSILPGGLGRLTDVDDYEGARLTFDTGVIVTVRPSGNAPELRCYVEAGTDEQARKILEQTLERIAAVASRM